MMEKLKFDYSMKNISVTTERSYLLKLIEQTETVIKRMHWKHIYCDMKGNSIKIETYGFNQSINVFQGKIQTVQLTNIYKHILYLYMIYL